MKVNLPVGVSDFEEIRKGGYYYIDKSSLVSELLETTATKITLITRPRRFGKTMGMKMLADFFDIRKDSSVLFDGLEISRNPELCEKWMNQYPTVFFSLKDVSGLNFENAYEMLRGCLAYLFQKFSDLPESKAVNDYERTTFWHIANKEASVDEVKSSLFLLTRMLAEHYGKQVILLLDEYDVPVAKAADNGYYREMLDVIKIMLSMALKDNTFLRFAVITGCLKITKESIFTGTKNFVYDTISSSRLNEFFGFTQKEVEKLLKDTGFGEQVETVQAWYDGYRFGDMEIYCPWDVMNYVRDLQADPLAKPKSYWKNTSDNAIIRSFIEYAGSSITSKLEKLMAGETIVQKVEEELTYDVLHSSEENLWSVLYLTGYLTKAKKTEPQEELRNGEAALVIPNAEIREIFESTVKKWFDDSARAWNRKALFHAVWSGDSEVVTEEMGKLLRRTIRYHDYREDFYHAFLAGIFAGAGYMVESNREHGEGRSDVTVHDPVNGRVAVFEVKYSKSLKDMAADCEKAVEQIDARMYADEFEDTYDEIFCYGISFFKKRCLVKRR